MDDSAFVKNTLSISPVPAVEIVIDAQFIFSLSLNVVARRVMISHRGDTHRLHAQLAGEGVTLEP